MLRLASFLALFAAASILACSDGAGDTRPSSSQGGSGPAGGGGSGEAGNASGGGGEGGTRNDGGGGAGGEGGLGGAGGGFEPDCFVENLPGTCIEVSECEDLAGMRPTPGHCPGPVDIQCCTVAPDPSDNPPIPNGYTYMKQADVTSEMTDWAVDILHDPASYPMFSKTLKTFDGLTILARVEWHPPDFQNSVVHRGVTLYEPL